MNKLKNLIFVTGNSNKLKEVQSILGDHIPNIQSAKIDLPEIQGDPEEITKHKAKYASKLLNSSVLIEDTSLCYNALGGLPGPYVKWFYDKIGNQGLYNLLSAYSDKSCKAVCLFGLCDVNKEPIIFRGECDGIISKPKGDNKFGWDPIFVPTSNNHNNKTFAEMDPDEKNKISHRCKALLKVKEYIAI